jgi:hypothetical protein
VLTFQEGVPNGLGITPGLWVRAASVLWLLAEPTTDGVNGTQAVAVGCVTGTINWVLEAGGTKVGVSINIIQFALNNSAEH